MLAQEHLIGKFGALILVLIVASLIQGAILSITHSNPGLGVFSILIEVAICSVFWYSWAKIFLDLRSKKPEVGDLFSGAQSDKFKENLLLCIRVTVFTTLWTLLLIVPGIIKSLAYSQSFYIRANDPSVDAATAQKKSIEMMQGRKGEYFVLLLSFIPWYLFVLMTCGIAWLYVAPYVGATLANYFRSISGVQSDEYAEQAVVQEIPAVEE
jgi:uncharacterized membrane protein